jgi:hypothetical protein
MRNPRPEAKLVVKVLAAAAIAACAALAACSTVVGTTPDCTYNLDGGSIQNIPNGCEQFAPCLDKDGNEQDPHACCVDSSGMPLTGTDLATCLYGYGAGPAPTTGGS